jgi:Arc/MetJ-type ribon-helix-helix transcriptional regulator
MAKIKVSHTIDEDLVNWIDSEIKKKRFASRSHAIEYAVKQLIESES